MFVLLSDMLKHKEGVVVAAQSPGIQDDYLSMKMPRSSRKRLPDHGQSRIRVEAHHNVNSGAHACPQGVEALHGRCIPNHGRGRIRAVALHAWHNQEDAAYEMLVPEEKEIGRQHEISTVYSARRDVNEQLIIWSLVG